MKSQTTRFEAHFQTKTHRWQAKTSRYQLSQTTDSSSPRTPQLLLRYQRDWRPSRFQTIREEAVKSRSPRRKSTRCWSRMCQWGGKTQTRTDLCTEPPHTGWRCTDMTVRWLTRWECKDRSPCSWKRKGCRECWCRVTRPSTEKRAPKCSCPFSSSAAHSLDFRSKWRIRANSREECWGRLFLI